MQSQMINLLQEIKLNRKLKKKLYTCVIPLFYFFIILSNVNILNEYFSLYYQNIPLPMFVQHYLILSNKLC